MSPERIPKVNVTTHGAYYTLPLLPILESRGDLLMCVLIFKSEKVLKEELESGVDVGGEQGAEGEGGDHGSDEDDEEDEEGAREEEENEGGGEEEEEVQEYVPRTHHKTEVSAHARRAKERRQAEAEAKWMKFSDLLSHVQTITAHARTM